MTIVSEPKLGDYVTTKVYGHKGRVTQIHFSNPQDDDWMTAQSDPRVREHAEGRWVRILCHSSGSVVLPASLVEVVEPFYFTNNLAFYYFRDVPDTSGEVGKYEGLWVMINQAGLRWSVGPANADDTWQGGWVTEESNQFTSWSDTELEGSGLDSDHLDDLATKYHMPAGTWININES